MSKIILICGKIASGKTYYVDYNNENILTTDFGGFCFIDY